MQLYYKFLILLVVVGLSACGGGTKVDVDRDNGTTSGNTDETKTTTPVNTAKMVFRTSKLADGDEDCPYGGVLLQTGIDDNLNSVLDSSEVDDTQKICNGEPGEQGPPGNSGGAGFNGPAGALSGQIFLEHDVPAEGAMVAVSGTMLYAYTDRFGRFEFSAVAKGVQQLIVSYDGYYSKKLENIGITHGGDLALPPIRLNKKRRSLEGDTLLSGFAHYHGKAAGAWSGHTVVSAGDVNADGYDDLLVGAHWAEGQAGETYLIYGRPGIDADALVNLPADVVLTGETSGDWSGYAVAGAGDVNGDGFDDILIGAHKAVRGIGKTYLVYGGEDLANEIDLKNANVIINGKSEGDVSGFSVAGPGDVNGDGFADILIGAHGVDTNTGQAYLIFGGNDLSGTISLLSADVTFQGKGLNHLTGYDVSGAGDVDGDGLNDFLIGAYGINETYLIKGRKNFTSYWVLGSADVTFKGKASGDLAGYTVAAGGDVNGDGFDDVLIGAYGAQSFRGESYLIFGGQLQSDVNLLDADVTFVGADVDEYSGFSLASAGDINGDGFGDVLIGAPKANEKRGRGYLIYGGPALSSAVSLGDAPAVFNGEQLEARSGHAVTGLGDLNGDGFADAAIGAYGVDNNAGESYLLMGAPRSSFTDANLFTDERKAATADVTFKVNDASAQLGTSLTGVGDVNGDGLQDVLIAAPGVNDDTGAVYLLYGKANLSGAQWLSSNPDVIFNGVEKGDVAGSAVATAGDVNADGYTDILIGAPGAKSGAGHTYVIYGRPDLAAEYDLGSSDIIIYGVAHGDDSGSRLTGLGDVNGDGFSDFLIGAPNVVGSAGSAYLFYGDDNLVTRMSVSIADVIIKSSINGDHVGHSVAGAGDVNGDGFDDILITAPEVSSSKGAAYIIYGSETLTGNVDTANADVSLRGKAINERLGWSAASAGDVNADGYDDVLISAVEASAGAGETYLILGKADLDQNISPGLADATLVGLISNDASGASVSGVGDVNGDGFDDFLIAASSAANGNGVSYLFYGGRWLQGVKSLYEANAQFVTKEADDPRKLKVAPTGDINADGFADFLIGAPVTNTNSGEAYLFYGHGQR